MTDTPPPTIPQALQGIDPVTRATLTHIVVQLEPARADCYRDQEYILGGPILAHDVQSQVLEVLAAGLLGNGAAISTGDRGQGWIIETSPDYRQAAAVIAGHRDGQTLRILEEHRTTALAAAQARRLAIADGLPVAALDAIGPAATPSSAPMAVRESGADPATAPLVRMKQGHSLPCVVCRQQATTTLLGRPVHGDPSVKNGGISYCLARLRADLAGAPDESGGGGASAHQEPASQDLDRLDSSASETTQPAPSPATTQEVEPQAETPRRPEARKPRRARAVTGPRGNEKGRWAAPAAALDEKLHLPGGLNHDWDANHIGELAMLTTTHRLGWGGGESLPDPGELWIYPAALQRLGLPETVELPQGGTKAEREAAWAEVFEALNDVPAVAHALTDGWTLGQGGRMGPRTRISHPTLLPRGALLEVLSWSDVAGVPLLAKELEGHDFRQLVAAPVLPDRLLAFAAATGVTYRISPAITGVDLIDRTKPPREPGTPLQRGTKATVQRWSAAELPEFKRSTGDSRFSLIERNFSWHRRWDDLEEKMKAKPYAIAFDHSVHFLNPWISTQLGVEGLVHATGEGAAWDGTERPAYFLVERWESEDRSIPDPIDAASAVLEDGRVIVTCHTLRQLQMIDPIRAASVKVHESWTWSTAPKYLAQAGGILRDARYGPDPFVAETAKQIYSATTQKLASVEHNPSYHLWRPDWRDMIMGASRTAVMALILSVRNLPGGLTPLVVDRDTVIYAADHLDPQQAWPGKPEKYGWGPGQWKPIGAADLAEWGPSALAGSGRGWTYDKHMRAMTRTEQMLSEPSGSIGTEEESDAHS